MIYRVWWHILSRIADIRAERARRRGYFYAEKYADLLEARDNYAARLIATARINRKDA